MAEKSTILTNAFFEVHFLVSAVTGMEGRFAKVSGLGINFDYEQYYEGGSMYPRMMFNSAKPQTLVLEQGVVTHMGDLFSWWSQSLNLGMFVPAAQGIIKLKDTKGNTHREWTITGAYLTKYEGPTLDANGPAIAVSRIEMIYGGVF